MKSLHTYTPVRIALPFICGILPGFYFSTGQNPMMYLLCASIFFGALTLVSVFFGTSYGYRWLPGVCANISLILMGFLTVLAINVDNEKCIIKVEELAAEKVLICSLESKPSAKQTYSVCKATVIAGLDSTGKWQMVSSGIIVYFKEDTACLSLNYGSRIILYGNLQPVREPSNPYAFNFKKYLYDRRVFHQVYLEKGQWLLYENGSGNFIYRIAGNCRDAFLDVFRDFKIAGEEFALVSALLLGVTEYLDPETRQEFSYAGATHILSVSGLHVAIVYAAADKILFFLKRGKRSRAFHSVLIILFIWFYALITGLTVSVVRASLMFSLVAAANLLRRSSWNYNILAVSAFLQLWINPFEILDIGFQLSYLAVLGIFAFYQPFNNLIQSGNRYVNWIWPVIAVSCAAQLTTSPLASYYFHIFPAYFLITNLLVVPLSGLIIYLSIALLAISTFGITFPWMALPLNWSLILLEKSVELIQGWPGAVIRNIVFTPLQVILIFLSILSIYGLFIMARRKWAFALAGSVLLFICTSFYQQFKLLKNNQLVVYNISGHSAIDLFHKKACFFLADSLLKENAGKIDFQIVPNRVNNKIGEVNFIEIKKDTVISNNCLWKNNAFISFSGKRIVIIGDQMNAGKTEKQLLFDLAIIHGDSWLNPEELISKFDIKQIIIDSSVPLFKSRKLKNQLEQKNILVHSVRDDGAYILKW